MVEIDHLRNSVWMESMESIMDGGTDGRLSPFDSLLRAPYNANNVMTIK